MTAPDLFGSVASSAVFSECRRYRYTLTREWGIESPVRSTAVFIGLNPSTADEQTNDPTIRRDIGFAKRFGHGRMVKVNLFALRSTEPLGLLDVPDPNGPDNDRHLLDICRDVASTVICCWGSHRKTKDLARLVSTRAAHVRDMLLDHGIGTFYFGANDDGQPKHTLYLSKEAPLRCFR